MSEAKKVYDAKLDPKYASPKVDIDEWRERILNGVSIPYRHVHGYFEGTNVRFLFCYPKKEQFQGRFFQHNSPFPGPNEENASLVREGEEDRIAFALTHGAYFVECNMGSQMQFAGQIDIYQTNAAAAEYSRVVAMEMYGCGRPYGYVYGGSGGGYKTISCIENANAWDGAVPYVIGSPASLPSCLAVRVHALRNLRHVYGRLFDAIDAGGKMDMLDWMTKDEADAYLEAKAMGLPDGTWALPALGYVSDGSMPVLAPNIHRTDPTYFEDFWSKPGYLGADPNGSAARDRLQFRGIVKAVHAPEKMKIPVDAIDGRNNVDDAWQKMLADGSKAWIELEQVPQGDDLYLEGVNITFETGNAIGKRLLLGGMEGKRLIIGMCFGVDSVENVINLIQPGDVVFLDNSDYIAVQTYHRHTVPDDRSLYAWDCYRDKEGKPLYPQRSDILGYLNVIGTGAEQTGAINGKVIVVEAHTDESAYPWQADWYRKQIAKTMGGEKEYVRVWQMEHCLHGDVAWLDNSYIVNYLGALHQAMLDLSDWVERGMEPPQTTGYAVENGQILLPETAKKRKGVQPVIIITGNGKKRVEAKPGEKVRLEIRVEVPAGTGTVTAIDLYRDDSVQKPEPLAFGLTKNGAKAKATVSYDVPGTYFATVRVKVNRHGDAADIFTQVKNLDRTRIVVKA